MLDDYLAWLTSQPLLFLDAGWAEGHEYFEYDETERISPKWHNWLETLEVSPNSSISKAGDSLHLSAHPGEMGVRDPRASLTITDSGGRRAAFLTTPKDAWYYDALERVRQVPNIAPNSWRVDVVTTPGGFLGTYRLSRATWLMFTCKHSLHMTGN